MQLDLLQILVHLHTRAKCYDQALLDMVDSSGSALNIPHKDLLQALAIIQHYFAHKTHLHIVLVQPIPDGNNLLIQHLHQHFIQIAKINTRYLMGLSDEYIVAQLNYRYEVGLVISKGSEAVKCQLVGIQADCVIVQCEQYLFIFVLDFYWQNVVELFADCMFLHRHRPRGDQAQFLIHSQYLYGRLPFHLYSSIQFHSLSLLGDGWDVLKYLELADLIHILFNVVGEAFQQFLHIQRFKL